MSKAKRRIRKSAKFVWKNGGKDALRIAIPALLTRGAVKKV